MITRPLMTLEVIVAAPHRAGARTIAPVTGGTFEGDRLRGKVLGGADWLLLRDDGVLELELRLALETNDGAVIAMTSFGLRHGPADVIAAIGRGERVDPASYYFRTTPRFECAAPRYQFLDRLLAVGTGDRRPTGPIYTIDELL